MIDATKEVPTCRLQDTVGHALSKLNEGDPKNVVVTTDGGIVLGRLRARQLRSDADMTVDEAMEIGPTTFRADVSLEALVDRMKERKVGSVLVTNAGGQLLGIFYRADGENLLAGNA